MGCVVVGWRLLARPAQIPTCMIVAPGPPRGCVLAGMDCGFDSSAGMGRVAEDVVWAKLRALRDGARIASERLF